MESALKERYLDELKTFLRIPSVSTDPERKGDVRRAAEFVASDVLEPLFSSRRPSSPSARDLASDAQFRKRMGALFAGAPSGIATIPTLDAVIDRLDALEAQIARRD